MAVNYNQSPIPNEELLLYLKAESHLNNGTFLFNHARATTNKYTLNSDVNLTVLSNKLALTDGGTLSFGGPSINALSSNFTVSFWFWADPLFTAQWYRFILKGTQELGDKTWMFNRYSSNNTLCLRLDTTERYNFNHYFNGTQIDGTWHHIAATISNDGSVVAYVDGEYNNDWGPYTNSGYDNSIDLGIYTSSTGSYVGMDNIMIHHTILNAEQVRALYNATKGVYQ